MNIIRYTDPAAPGYSELWKLYLSAFPEWERRPECEHINCLGDSDFNCCGLFDGDTFVGLMIWWQTSTGHAYVDYLAIRGELRGKNHGGTALDAFTAQHSAVILDIEPPVDAPTIRRRRFYERHGFVWNDYAFIHPAYKLRGGDARLDLMSRPGALEPAEIESFERWLTGKVVILLSD